jgi:drug/metabolite transporter (DMT)-like permease
MLVLFIFGLAFYKLAEQFHKKRWLWAVVGAVSYVILQLLIGAAYGILYELGIITFFDESVLNIGGVLVAGLLSFVFYMILKKKWTKEQMNAQKTEIEEIGQSEN